MLNVPVAYMRLDSRDGTAILSIQVQQPVERLAASVYAHDSVDVAWRVGLELKSTDNPLVWRAAWKLNPDLPPLLEVGNVNNTTPTWGPIDICNPRWVFLKPETGDGEWVTGERAQAELVRIEALREQRFTAPLIAPGASQNAPEFLVLAIADDLVITQPQRVPGISLSPVSTVLGDDVRSVLNRMLLQRRFRQRLPRRPWLEHMQSARPAVLIECHVRADTATDAKTFGSEVIKRLLDMMTLRRDAAARLIAGIVASPNESGRLEIREVWIEHTGYHGNLLGGVIAGEDVHQLQESWNGLQANPRAQLWVSLYADAVRDPRWDYQFFRCFNLLEAIADTAVQPGVDIVDEAGNPRPLPKNKRKHFTTGGTQGKVYTLLTRLAGGAADDQLWDEVVLWAEVRHEVAHEGTWQPPDSAETAEHAATRAAITSRGGDGTFESGAQALVDKIRESVKRALYAAIHGSL